jgi:arginase
MTSIALIQVPYHLGREGVGLGKGVPLLRQTLAGPNTQVVTAEREGDFRNEIAACMAVIRAVAACVRDAIAAGLFPVVLAGNCSSALGAVAALGEEVGVLWFDAHADFHTPETTRTGFFDGMPLAMLTGTGWNAMRAAVDGLKPVREENVVLVGSRAIDEGERERLNASRIALTARGGLDAALGRLRERVESVYLHIDLDVLDPSVGRANWWAAEGGLSVREVESAVEEIGRRFAIRAAALTAYQPDADPEGTIPPAARAVYERIVTAAGVAVPT